MSMLLTAVVCLLSASVSPSMALRSAPYPRMLQRISHKSFIVQPLRMSLDGNSGDSFFRSDNSDPTDGFEDEPISRGFLPSGPWDLATVEAGGMKQPDQSMRRYVRVYYFSTNRFLHNLQW